VAVLVLDTNIVSYLMRGDTRAEKYRGHIEGKTLAISFMTVGELYEGAYRGGWIAATALAHDCPLVTHDPGDFADITGLSIITEHQG